MMTVTKWLAAGTVVTVWLVGCGKATPIESDCRSPSLECDEGFVCARSERGTFDCIAAGGAGGAATGGTFSTGGDGNAVGGAQVASGGASTVGTGGATTPGPGGTMNGADAGAAAGGAAGSSGADAAAEADGAPPTCPLTALPSVEPPDEGRLFPATDESYWYHDVHANRLTYHTCNGVEATLDFGAHVTLGTHAELSVFSLNGARIAVFREFPGGERLFEIYDAAGTRRWEYTQLRISLPLVDGNGRVFTFWGDTMDAAGPDGIERTAAVDGFSPRAMLQGGVLLRAGGTSDTPAVVGWDGVSPTASAILPLPTDLCTENILSGPYMVAVRDADNFVFGCVTQFSISRPPEEFVQVFDGQDTCVVAPPDRYLAASGDGAFDADGNLFFPVMEFTDFDTSSAAATGIGRIERGSCAYASRVADYELLPAKDGCSSSSVFFQLSGVTETTAWGYRVRTGGCEDSYDWGYERVQLGAQGELVLRDP